MPMDLAEFLESHQKNSSYRDMETKLGVSRGSIENIVKRKNSDFPKIETLSKIADAYGKELWEVMLMAGVNLGLPKNNDERAKRLAQLLKRQPSLDHLIERLTEKMDSDPGYVDGMIMGLEASLGVRPDAPPDPAQ